MRNAQLTRQRFEASGGGIGSVPPLRIDEVDHSVFDRFHAQSLTVQPQASDFTIEHADPPAGECGVAVKLSGQVLYGNLDNGRVGDGERVAVVLGGFEAGFTHESLACSLQHHGLSLQSCALKGYFPRDHIEHPVWSRAGVEYSFIFGAARALAECVDRRRQKCLEIWWKNHTFHMTLIIWVFVVGIHTFPMPQRIRFSR